MVSLEMHFTSQYTHTQKIYNIFYNVITLIFGLGFSSDLSKVKPKYSTALKLIELLCYSCELSFMFALNQLFRKCFSSFCVFYSK